MASEQFDEFMRAAQTTGSVTEAQFFIQLAKADALGRIADVLEAAWAEVKEADHSHLPKREDEHANQR